MRLRVVYDENGRIVAAAAVSEPDDYDAALVPLAGPRQTAAEIDVPDDMATEELDVICTRMRVVTTGDRPMLSADDT
jgi:hypothetical protein